MKFTLNWLKDHLETNANISEIESTLTNIGLEVDSLIDRSEELKPFRVAKVINVKKHPDADRLKVCEVETTNGNFQVVCGAPNAKKGMLGIFAPENSFIPGTSLKLKRTKIRGVESCGMLVSEKEMGISDEHEGIIEIDSNKKIGDSFSNVYGLDDPIFEINITPNRSDCLSVRGIARDLAAAGLGSLKHNSIKKIQGSFISNIKWKRDFISKNENLCLGVSGRLFKNVKNSESPDWLKKRLIAIGLRPISALVDITNFITFDLGRPLHVYDADKLKGNLSMRLAKKGEKCKTLDEKEYELDLNMVVIADDTKLHGIGGLMGGLDSGCTLNTQNVFLEVALFDPIAITKAGRKLNLQSDARFRFERGVDPTSIEWGVDKATEMILELCGGTASEITCDQSSLAPQKIIEFNNNDIQTIGGIDIETKDQISILENLGFKTKIRSENIIEVIVPNFRPDIDSSADIVEEITRIYGFDKIVPQSIIKDIRINRELLGENLKAFYKSKRLIASRGYLETITWSFISSKYSVNKNINSGLKILNPISSDLNVMRDSIFPNLLESINININRLYGNGKLFEVGPQFQGSSEKDQQMMATGIQYGVANSILWNEEKRFSDVFDIKSDLFFVLNQLNVPIDNLIYKESTNSIFHPGKSADLLIGKNIIARFGEIHPVFLNDFDIKTNVNGFEIFLDKIGKFLLKKTGTKNPYDNNVLQLVERDFAFLFPQNIKSVEIVNLIKKINKELIKKVTIFDVYEGNKLPANTKSIAIKVILQPSEKTFTDEEIEKISNEIIKMISNNLDGKLRH